MNEALSQLRDIHLPEPVGWWPPAPGWWLLAASMIILIVGLWAWFVRRRRRNALYRSALAELESIRRRHARSADGEALVADLSQLLRRVAISRYPQQEVASLVGTAWLNWLDRHLNGQPFELGVGRVLVEAPYRPGHSQVDSGALLALVGNWLERAARDV